MGKIISGALTARRYRVVGEIPDDFRTVYKERLVQHAFKEDPIANEAEQMGWVQHRNLMDTDFRLNDWLYDRYAIFSLRIDKRTLPSVYFKAHLAKKIEAWCQENNVERCPIHVKKLIKEEMTFDWLKRAFPTVTLGSIGWNIHKGYLLFDSLSVKLNDQLRTKFYRTFGLKLEPWSYIQDLPQNEANQMITMSATRLFFGECDAK